MDLYHDVILDHYHNPRNRGILTAPTHRHCAVNHSCGDNICITLIIDDARTIHDIAFDGVGCAISQAAASLLTEHVRGKTVTDVQSLTRNDMLALLGVAVGVGRIRCALLGLETLHKALHTTSQTP